MTATLRVFNIERFATEDGPGIRTVVFLKGCTLRCRWCANPESQSFRPEVLLKSSVCTGCGRCSMLCPSQAIRLHPDFGFITDPAGCTHCGQCCEGCYSDARELLGRDYTPEELLEVIRKDEDYYRTSGGGVTFSGGEPCWQSEGIARMGELLRKREIPVLIETCGHVPQERLQQASQWADAIYYDIKQTDPLRHRELTGDGNEQILDNLRWLRANYSGSLSVRYPYIPGCNDRPEDIQAFFRLLRELGLPEATFLPYHRLGIDKYKGLGRTYEMGDLPSLRTAALDFLKDVGAAWGIRVRIQ